MSEIQAVIFEKAHWNTTHARHWLKMHDLKPIKRVHNVENFLRYRLADPKKFRRFITKKLPNGIELIIGYP